mmetsp:Transcript_29496/g.59375  ORF Transcript_29496/g.59375 Transcript_29496/m.59375 type:complete len:211 (-) Transcript_29496:68-700(-)
MALWYFFFTSFGWRSLSRPTGCHEHGGAISWREASNARMFFFSRCHACTCCLTCFSMSRSISRLFSSASFFSLSFCTFSAIAALFCDSRLLAKYARSLSPGCCGATSTAAAPTLPPPMPIMSKSSPIKLPLLPPPPMPPPPPPKPIMSKSPIMSPPTVAERARGVAAEGGEPKPAIKSSPPPIMPMFIGSDDEGAERVRLSAVTRVGAEA